MKESNYDLLDQAVCAHDVLDVVSVRVLEAEATGTEPDPVLTLGLEAIHHRQHLALQLQHCNAIMCSE